MNMHRTTMPVVVFAVTALMAVTCLARDNTKEQALRTAEKARFEANVKADTAALDKLLDADLDYTHSNGDLETKARFIQALTDGTRDYVAFDGTLEKVRVFGDVGLIHGRAHVTVTSGGATSTFDISFDDAWLWKDGRWQLTSWRSTKLPNAAAQQAPAKN